LDDFERCLRIVGRVFAIFVSALRAMENHVFAIVGGAQGGRQLPLPDVIWLGGGWDFAGIMLGGSGMHTRSVHAAECRHAADLKPVATSWRFIAAMVGDAGKPR